jgi:hypothetical protein
VIDGDERELFERTVHAAVDGSSGAALDDALDELGWADALADDRRTAVSILFERLGAANATSRALDLVLNDALGLAADPSVGVVLPPIGRWEAPATLNGDRVTVTGLALGPAESYRVLASSGDKDVVLTVPASVLAITAIDGVDPDLGLVAVGGDVIDANTLEVAPAPWPAAVDAGRLAVAHQLVGASRAMLALACEHARERIQFGVPIGSFQAVRHRLAETLVAIEQADAVLDAAWLDGTSTSAAMAKATAGRQARIAARHCQQVLAGIGFTTEHPFHRYLRRLFVLDGLFGTASTLTTELGRQVLAAQQLPPLLPL